MQTLSEALDQMTIREAVDQMLDANTDAPLDLVARRKAHREAMKVVKGLGISNYVYDMKCYGSTEIHRISCYIQENVDH